MSNPINYFAFYHLPISFFIDERALKRKFYAYSKKFHPDFYVQASKAEQEQALTQASFNNKAYKTLSSFDGRMKYILQLSDLLPEGERYALPQSFLMDMMDINEQLMELQFESDTTKINTLQQEVSHYEAQLQTDIQPILVEFEQLQQQQAGEKQTFLKKIKEFYYKKRYLLRIQKSLNKFA